MHFDIASDFNLSGGLPKGAARRALDAEIANEGGKVIAGDVVILSNGEQVAWTPPPEKLAIPDLSVVKSLRHYFGARGYQAYPAWLYHPTKPAILVKNASEAAEHGVVHRKATNDERNRFGVKDVWDWEEGVEWRPNPLQEAKFDPKNPGSGKTVVYGAPDPRIGQNELIAQLIPAVAAAVAQSLKATGPAAPASVDPSQWEAFLAFQAWQKAQEVVTAAASGLDDLAEMPSGEDGEEVVNALSPEQDRLLWEEEAKRLGVKVDGRWSIERLKAEVQKASPTTGLA
jgi:hypothetical protein